MLPDKSYLTASSLESITMYGSDILKAVTSLDINKAHGWYINKSAGSLRWFNYRAFDNTSCEFSQSGCVS